MTIYDNFRKKCRLINKEDISSNGKWICAFPGVADWDANDTGLQGIRDRGIFFLYPYWKTYTGSDTDASLAITNQQYTDFDVTFQMRTVRQLKTTFVKNWEVAWLFFRFNENGHPRSDALAYRHYYYLLLKTNGHIEIGKKDTDIDQQRFLTGTVGQEPTFTFAINQWYKVRVRVTGFRIQMWLDDVLKWDDIDDGTLTDTSGTIPAATSLISSGRLGLYSEDAEVEFKPLDITVL
jgi:hypothetical protein